MSQDLDPVVYEYAKKDLGEPPLRDVEELYSSPNCTSWYGCWNGYCWAGCTNLGIAYPEWCYTAPINFVEGSYQSCSSKDDCSNCWECTGNCNTFLNF